MTPGLSYGEAVNEIIPEEEEKEITAISAQHRLKAVFHWKPCRLKFRDVTGLGYNPFTARYFLTTDARVNYMTHFKKKSLSVRSF